MGNDGDADRHKRPADSARIHRPSIPRELDSYREFRAVYLSICREGDPSPFDAWFEYNIGNWPAEAE